MKHSEKFNLAHLPAFKLLIIISIIIYPTVYLGLSSEIALGISIFFSFVSIILIFFKKKLFFYLSSAVSIGFILSYFVLINHLPVPNQYVRDFDGLFTGKIVSVLKDSPKYKRLIIEGDLDIKEISEIKNTRVLAMVFKSGKYDSKLIPGTKIYTEIKVRLPKKQQLPNEFDEVNYLKTINCSWFAQLGSNKIAFLSAPKGIDYIQYKMLSKINEILDKLYPIEYSGLANALITGDKTEIDKKTKDAFALSGTAHLLALSGFNTAIIAAGIFLILGFIRNQYIKFSIFTILLLLFLFLAGFQASALRAAAMAILYMFLKIKSRAVNALNVASFVLLFIIIINPQIVENISFQLSALAILSILILYNPIEKSLLRFAFFAKLPKYFASSVALTLSASFVVSPLASFYFNTYSLVSVPANLLVVPIMSLSTIFSLLSVLFAFYMPLASIYASANSLCFSLTKYIINLSIKIPHSFILGNEALIVAFLFSLCTLYLIFSKSKNQLYFRIIIVVLISFLSMSVFKINEKDTTKIIARNQLVFVEFPAKDNIKHIILCDRKPHISPKQDFSLQEYLKSKKEKLIIGYNGNAGIKTIDNIQEFCKVEKYELSLETQNRIRHLLKLKEYLPQYTNYEK